MTINLYCITVNMLTDYIVLHCITFCLYYVICNKHQKFLKSLTKKQCTLLFSLDTENKVFHCTFRVLGTQLVSHISQIPTTMLLLIQFTYWSYLIFVIFPPRVQFLAQFFSTQKRVNCTKKDFATKQRNLQNTDFATKHCNMQQNTIN